MSVALVSPASPAVVRPVTQAVPAPADPKIKPRHLAKQAFIYVRQSSPGQVQRHPESARRQYALAQRAERLGWPGDQVVIIDEDQGKSAAGSAAAHDRDGFARLVSSVGLGEVGLILALEVARLARNSAEWYRQPAASTARPPTSSCSASACLPSTRPTTGSRRCSIPKG